MKQGLETQETLPLQRRRTLHLLTISFDPDYDSPRVLRKYAFSVSGERHSGLFKHWEFAVPPAAELPKLANFFGLYYEKDGGRVTHSLVAAVIGPDDRQVVSGYGLACCRLAQRR